VNLKEHVFPIVEDLTFPVLLVPKISLPLHFLGPRRSLSKKELVLDRAQQLAACRNTVVGQVLTVNRRRPTLLRLSNPSGLPGIDLAESDQEKGTG